MFLKIFDYLSLAVLVFLSYGVFVQWWHIYKTKSVKDIVTREVVIRFFATLILFIKLVLVGDPYLIIGQAVFLAIVTIYLITLARLKLN